MTGPILAIATAGDGCIAALRTNASDHVLFWPERRGMDGYLVPMLQEMLHDHAVEWKDLARIGVVTGPGSFTGLRIGLATAQGLGIALNVPVIGVSAFDVWRKAAACNGKLLIALNTLRDDAFCALYEGEAELVSPKVCDVSEWKALLDGAQVCGDAPFVNDRTHIEIDHEGLAKALLDITVLADPTMHLPEPLYLRAPEISAPRAA